MKNTYSIHDHATICFPREGGDPPFEARHPATCPRDPVILLKSLEQRIKIDPIARRRELNWQRLLLSIISLLFLTTPAQAKSETNWTGSYAGLNLGAIFNNANVNANHPGLTNPNGTCNKNANFSSIYPGLQIGYTRQLSSKMVWGIEADYTNNVNKQDNANCTCDVNPGVSDKFTIKNQQQGSIRSRLGYSLENHLLPFFMAGGSLANTGMTYRNEGGDHYSKNTTTPAWLVGAGLEWQFAQAWSIRTEYFYGAYNNVNMQIPRIYGLSDLTAQARVNLNANNIRAAINYWF